MYHIGKVAAGTVTARKSETLTPGMCVFGIINSVDVPWFVLSYLVYIGVVVVTGAVCTRLTFFSIEPGYALNVLVDMHDCVCTRMDNIFLVLIIKIPVFPIIVL